MAELGNDPSLFIEVVSYEPGMGYLEAHTFHNERWNILSRTYGTI